MNCAVVISRGAEYDGFSAADVLYLLMPDRFAKGGDDNKQSAASLRFPTGK